MIKEHIVKASSIYHTVLGLWGKALAEIALQTVEDHNEAVLLQTMEAPAAVGCDLKNAAAHGEPTQVFFWQKCGPSWANAWAVCCWRTAPHGNEDCWSVLEEWQPGRKWNLLGGRSDRGYLLRRGLNLHCQPLTPLRAQGTEMEELGVKLRLGRRSGWGEAGFVLFLTILLYFYLTINCISPSQGFFGHDGNWWFPCSYHR